MWWLLMLCYHRALINTVSCVCVCPSLHLRPHRRGLLHVKSGFLRNWTQSDPQTRLPSLYTSRWTRLAKPRERHAVNGRTYYSTHMWFIIVPNVYKVRSQGGAPISQPAVPAYLDKYLQKRERALLTSGGCNDSHFYHVTFNCSHNYNWLVKQF